MPEKLFKTSAMARWTRVTIGGFDRQSLSDRTVRVKRTFKWTTDKGQIDEQTDERTMDRQTIGQTDKHDDGHDIRLSGKSKRKKNMELELELELQRRRRRPPQMGPAWLEMGAWLERGLGEMVSVRVNGFLIAGGRFKSRQCNLCCFFWGSLFTFLLFLFLFLAFFYELSLDHGKKLSHCGFMTVKLQLLLLLFAAVCAAWQMQSGLGRVAHSGGG